MLGFVAKCALVSLLAGGQASAPPTPTTPSPAAKSTTPTAATSNLTERQRAYAAASPDARVRIAEEVGEEGARAFAKAKGWTPVLTNADKAIPQGFDQVYRDSTGKLVVVEAKGGGSPLAKAYGTEQGTAEWAVQAAKRVASSPKASPAEVATAHEVLKAAKAGSLEVVVVRTKHVFGEPKVAILEASSKASHTTAMEASAILGQLAPSTNVAPATTGNLGSPPKQGKPSLSGAGPISKGAGLAGMAVDLGMRATQVVETEQAYGKGGISARERGTRHARNAGGLAGGWSAGWAGAAVGATGGGMVFGPLGAFAGGLFGGIAGYLGGDVLGSAIGEGIAGSSK